uniref:Uncharacterized protein n=1 Tax=Ananas comosus var. bracteatus TaxID=296719 RepID=A0A6V7QVS6_ANACO
MVFADTWRRRDRTVTGYAVCGRTGAASGESKKGVLNCIPKLGLQNSVAKHILCRLRLKCKIEYARSAVEPPAHFTRKAIPSSRVCRLTFVEQEDCGVVTYVYSIRAVFAYFGALSIQISVYRTMGFVAVAGLSIFREMHAIQALRKATMH